MKIRLPWKRHVESLNENNKVAERHLEVLGKLTETMELRLRRLEKEKGIYRINMGE